MSIPSYSQLLSPDVTIRQLAHRKKLIHLKYGIREIWIPWTGRQRNKRVLEQIRPETWLEAKMTKLRLSYFRHFIRRQGYLEASNAGEKS